MPVKVYRYLSSTIAPGEAMRGQPKPQLYFHRPLQTLLGACFQAGFAMDGLEERAFPPEVAPGKNPLGWSGKFSEIPPVLVARMKLA